MVAPLVLLLVSALGCVAALTLPGFSDLLLLAGPSLLASLWLLLRMRRATPPERWIVIDGSNVMHWNDGKPQIETLRSVVNLLKKKGFTPGVMFDANAGYLLTGRYQHDRAMGKSLGLPEDRIMVVPKGSPADPAILTAARDLGASVVTNDRYRDWVDQFPEVREPGHLIRGGYRDGAPWLDLPDTAAQDRARTRAGA